MKIFLLLVFIVTALTAFCQEEKAPERFSFIASPALMQAPNVRLALQPGVQWHVRKWAVLAEVAFPVTQIPGKQEEHYRLSGEVKRYVNKKGPPKTYISVQAAYTKRTFWRDSGVFFRRRTYNAFYFDRARIQSPIGTLTVKAGHEFRVGKKIFIDAFGGLGWRSIFTVYKNIENERPRQNWLWLDPWPRAHRFNNTQHRPHLTAGFRVGVDL